MFDFLKKKDAAQTSESTPTPEQAESAPPEALALNPASPDPSESVIDAKLTIPQEWDAPKGTFVAEDTSIEGSMSTRQDLNVAGSIGGNVACGGSFDLDHGGEVRGDIVAEGDATISGLVHGDIKVDGKLTISQTGCVHGNVRARALVMEEGGELHGQCATGVPKPNTKSKKKSKAKAAADPAFLTRMFDDDDAAPALAAVSA